MTDMQSLNQSLFEALMVEVLPRIALSGGKYSVGIVNNINGKRLTISKSLAERLALSDSVCVMPSAEKGKLVLGKTLPFPSASKVNLNGTGKKIAYNAELVQVLTQAFKLDFSKCTSRTFNNVSFDELEGVPIAILTFP